MIHVLLMVVLTQHQMASTSINLFLNRSGRNFSGSGQSCGSFLKYLHIRNSHYIYATNLVVNGDVGGDIIKVALIITFRNSTLNVLEKLML